jgi:hypothetical protein
VTESTARFLLSLLDQVSLQASSPNFAEAAALVVASRQELESVLAELDAETKIFGVVRT